MAASRSRSQLSTQRGTNVKVSVGWPKLHERGCRVIISPRQNWFHSIERSRHSKNTIKRHSLRKIPPKEWTVPPFQRNRAHMPAYGHNPIRPGEGTTAVTDQPAAFAVAGRTYRCQWRGLIWLIGAWPRARAACNTGEGGGMQQWRTPRLQGWRRYTSGAWGC